MEKITINVPIVYRAQDIKILIWANPFRGPLEWLENRDHVWPEMAMNEPHLRQIGVEIGEVHHTCGTEVRSAFNGRVGRWETRCARRCGPPREQ
jgi:hypothetical protein